MASSPVSGHPHDPPPAPIRRRVQRALASPQLGTALERALPTFRERRNAAFATGDFAPLRDELARRRAANTAELDELIERFTREATAVGCQVHRAATAEDACQIVTEIATERGVKLAVKTKSMATEEIHLNDYLARHGIRAVETDLGEWILQLDHDRPSHLIGPAIHKTREQVAEIFRRELGEEIPDAIDELVKVAQRHLRQTFIDADMGISGANFLIAETGTIVLIENEGNQRLCTTLPRVHVAVAGIDKLVRSVDDVNAALKLLARSATGQKVSTYVSYITGPSRSADIELSLSVGVHGPREVHVVLLDNGRSAMRADPEFREALRCIRCGACSNVCPPYQIVGGHTFGHIYTGPIGLVLTPFHHGLDAIAGPQSLCVSCNACETVCPVAIPIPRLILRVRERVVEQKGLPWPKRFAIKSLTDAARIDRLLRLASLGQRPLTRGERFVRWVPFNGELVRWRSLPAVAERPLRDRLDGETRQPARGVLPGSGAVGTKIAYFAGCITDRLYPEVGEAVVKVLRALGCRVEYPAGQNCCGLIALNAGDRPDGQTLARQTIELLERVDADYILSASASCAIAITQDYAHLFADEPEWAARAEAVARRTIDFTTFMDRVARLPAGALARGPARGPLTYHDSCQSHNCLGLKAEPRRLLTEVCGLEVLEMRESSVCCGFGGSFSVDFPELSGRILDRKLRHALDTGAEAVVTDNPGCLMQLRGGLDRRTAPMRALHLAEVLAERLDANPPA